MTDAARMAFILRDDGYPYASLNWVCWRMKVKRDGPGHRALADTSRALDVVQAMMAHHGKIDVLESAESRGESD